MKFHLLILFVILFPLLKLNAQDKHKIDSLTQVLNKTKDQGAKFGLYKILSSLEDEKSKYKNEMLLNAELSGNNELQLQTFRFMAELSGKDSSQFYLDKMFALAKEKKNEEYQGWYYLYTGSKQYYFDGNTVKAMDLIQQANIIAVDNHLDSLAYEVNVILSSIHQDKGERLLQYKIFMQQLSLAEKIGDGRIALGTYWQIFWF